MLQLDSFVFNIIILTISLVGLILVNDRLKKVFLLYIVFYQLVALVDMKLAAIGSQIVGLNFIVYIIPVLVLMNYFYEIIKSGGRK
jgi:hypothetical protein